MPVKTFEEVVSGLHLSADEKKLFDSVIAKSPDLKRGWLAQDEFSRKMDEFSGKEKRLTDLEAYEAQMKEWSADAHRRIKAAQDAGVLDAEGKELWTQKVAEYEEKIKAAQLAGGDMTPEQIDARVKEIIKTSGLSLSQADIAAVMKSEGEKLVRDTFDQKYKEVSEDFNKKTIPTVAGFSAGVAVFAARYEKETGEVWDEKKAAELFDMMGKENNYNAYQVGEKMLAPAREKKDIQKKIDEGVAAKLAELGLPGSGRDAEGRFIPPPSLEQPKGALQSWMERTDPTKANGNVDIDAVIKAQAVKAGGDLQKEGKY